MSLQTYLLLLSQLLIIADATEAPIRQSAQEVTVQRNSRATQRVVFELCGGLSKSHPPRLIIYHDGEENEVRVFPNNSDSMRTPEQGVAAYLWNTDHSDCKYLTVRLWPSHFGNEVENVSVIINLPSLRNGTYMRRVDFLFISGTQPSTDLLVETSIEQVAFEPNAILPWTVSFYVSGEIRASSFLVRVLKNGSLITTVRPSNGLLNYSSEDSGVAASVLDLMGSQDNEVVVAVWPSLLEDQNVTISLDHLNGIRVIRSGMDVINFFFKQEDAETTTIPLTTSSPTPSTPEDVTTAKRSTPPATTTASSMDTTSPPSVTDFIGSPRGQAIVGAIPAVVVVGALVIIIVAVAVIVTRRRYSNYTPKGTTV